MKTMSGSILLVEDDENDAFFLIRALRRAGILNPIQHLRDGGEALIYFQGGGTFGDRNQYPLPGLVLLDLKLPRVMGLDVLKWMRGQDLFKSTVVIVLSASENQNDRASAYRDGANAYFVKPSDLDQLDVVASTLRDSWLNATQPATQLPNGPLRAAAPVGAPQPLRATVAEKQAVSLGSGIDRLDFRSASCHLNPKRPSYYLTLQRAGLHHRFLRDRLPLYG
jgi:DNA-binding response OmpR family regulator